MTQRHANQVQSPSSSTALALAAPLPLSSAVVAGEIQTLDAEEHQRQQEEEVKRRFLELVELALLGLQQHESQSMEEPHGGQQPGMILAVAPLLEMGLQQLPAGTLRRLLASCGAIVKAVLDLDCSQDQYNARVEPHIRAYVAALGELE